MTCEAKTPEDLEKLRKYAGYIRLALSKIPFVNVPANIFAIEATIADVIQDIQQGDGNASFFGLPINTSVLSATATVNTSIVFGGAMATGVAVAGPAVFITTMGIAIAAGVIGAANNETVRTVLSDPDLVNSVLNGNLGEYLNNKYGIDLSDILDAVGEAFTTGNIKDLKDLAKETACEFSKAQVAQPRRDPLTLDLDGDGLETVGINTANPILFDHDGDGVKTATGWIKPDDGFLVLDRNGNGQIDDGTELFGDSTPLDVGGKAEDGFAALAQEDTNSDGLVNASDARFADLRVWRDLNSDGITQEGELQTLEQAGIAALLVSKTEHSQQLPNGNLLADLGGFIRTDGSMGGLGAVTAQMGDIDLAENTFFSQFTDHISHTTQAQTLPDMSGSGRVRSLREAASLSPTLGSLVEQYAAASTRSAQLALVDSILAEWGKTSDLAVTGNGAYNGLPTSVTIAGVAAGTPAYDAWVDKLQTLERFNGRPFAIPAVNAVSVTVNLFNERKNFLNQSYDALRQSVYDGLLLQTRLKPYMDAVSLTISADGIAMDFTGTATALQTRHDAAPGEAARDLLDLQRISGTSLNGLGWDGLAQLRGWLADTVNNPVLTATMISALADFGYPGLQVNGEGTSSSEAVIGGNAGAILNGGGGNDLILGGDGDDMLNGGTGSDTLYGGAGNDTYVFNLGDGADTIIESHGDTGTDTLQFGYGILAGDIAISHDGGKLIFTHSNGYNEVSIANWFDSLADAAHRLDSVHFSDSSGYDLAALQLGSANADTLTGTIGNDILVGGAGDDVLTGDVGNDWLDGGAGNDQMLGGLGDDVYVVDSVFDTVNESAGEGIDTVDAKVSYTLTDNVENLTLVGATSISGTGNELDNIIVGNAGDNLLQGMDGNDTLIGNAGNDTLDAGLGTDVMAGGTGNDTYIVDTLADTVTEQVGQGIDTVKTDLGYTLVLSQFYNVGYSFFNFTRASSLLNRHSIGRAIAFLFSCHAAVSLFNVAWSGMRRSRHCLDKMLNSISAMFSQLPCFGV